MIKDKTETILVVDDTETNIDILLELLSSDYDVMVALDGVSALEIAMDESVDLILLDIMMPEMDGYEVCKILKKTDKTKDIPVIFITAKTDEDSIERAYDVGGIDYVTKPFKPKELFARVRTQLSMRSLISNLEYIASHDQMTGIYNRRKFFELSEYRFTRGLENLYAIMIDIDKFKAINDAYGHPTGDKVIKQTTKAINEQLNENAIFGRLGGEEFAIICNLPTKDEVVQMVDRIRKSVEQQVVLSDNATVIKFTISLGLAKASAETKNLDYLLKESDIGLYEAKDRGRNRTVFRD
ncbi:MAG: diguanylate cyclase [Campylobacterota bacterium]|nr:diguanylate cyclase [Campylobacterota bacterium]